MDLILILQTRETTSSTSKVEVGFFDTILEIKQKIQKDFGIPIANQSLFFNGNLLPDDLNIHDSDIVDRSPIKVDVAGIKDDDVSKIQLLLKMPSSKHVAVEVDADDTVQKLKEKIYQIEGVPPNRLIFHANGIELADQKSIGECGFAENNADVVVTVRAPRNSPATVRIVVVWGAEKITVEMNPLDNVGELRKKLQKMNVNLPRDGYFFIYKQNVMDDDQNFKWHGFSHGDSVEIFGGSVSGGS